MYDLALCHPFFQSPRLFRDREHSDWKLRGKSTHRFLLDVHDILEPKSPTGFLLHSLREPQLEMKVQDNVSATSESSQATKACPKL